MKKNLLLLVIFYNSLIQSQTFNGYLGSQSLNWTMEQKDFNSLPRVGIAPMSIKLWDNYSGLNAPSQFGSLLEINGRESHLTSQIYFDNTWNGGRILYRSAFYSQNTWESWRYLLDSKNDIESAGNLKITGNSNSYILNGHVGIGTLNPSNIQGWSKVLDVAGATNSKILATTMNSSYRVGIFSHEGWYGGGGFLGTESNHPLHLITNLNVKMSVLTNGNVGIGTTAPDQKLTVNGTIHSKEVIVDTNITPDYVFQKYYTGKSELKSDYVMPTLPEIENFTRINNHLPGVPSAKEMQEKGMSLGEMSNILLQKIEELTLYTIEQQKELERLKAENENYKALAERLSAIEKELKK